LTLEDLRVFVAVCRAGNLSAVARELRRSQPAVSQHVARLERELGVPLLRRGPTGVTPAPAGRVLFDAASAGEAALSMAVREIGRLRAGTGGELSISTGGTTVRHFMRESVLLFRSRRPDVSLRFEPASSTRECVEIVLKNRADLAFVTHTEELPGIQQRPVLEMPLVLLIAPGDPLARRRHVALRDLAAIRYVSLAAATSSGAFLRETLRAEGLEIQTVATVDDWDTAKVFVEIGVGHAIVPAVHAHSFAKEGGVRALPIRGLPALCVGWAARDFRLLPSTAHDFMAAFLRSASRWRRIRGVRLLATEREMEKGSRAEERDPRG
jgi:DNA-binding transcriptional LysR family regulator